MSHFPYKSGDWLAICDQCGLQAYASELTKRWDGYMVHKNPEHGCFEYRHPQDFVRVVPDNKPLPWTRPFVDGISVGPVFNCAGATPIAIPSRLTSTRSFGKGYSKGPIYIEDGATITVYCSWEIE